MLKSSLVFFLLSCVLFGSTVTMASSLMRADVRNITVSELIPLISVVSNSSYTFTPEISDVTVYLEMSGEMPRGKILSSFDSALFASGLSSVRDESGVVTIFKIGDERYKGRDSDISIAYVNVGVGAGKLVKSVEKMLSTSGFVLSLGDSLILVSDRSLILSSVLKYLNVYKRNEEDSAYGELFFLDFLIPSSVSFEGIKLVPNDLLGTVFAYGHKNLVSDFSRYIKGLDSSIDEHNVSIIVATVSSSVSDGFDFSGASTFGNFSMSFDSVSFSSSLGSDAFSFILDLVNSDSESTLHSRPFFNAVDGVNVGFSVGQDIPVLVSVIDADTGRNIRNVERRTVGLDLSVLTRSISSDRVLVSIDQSLSSVSDISLDGAVDLILNTQSISSSIIVERGKVYALGGLREVVKNSSETSFFFFDEPFSSSVRSSSRDLVVFIKVD